MTRAGFVRVEYFSEGALQGHLDHNDRTKAGLIKNPKSPRVVAPVGMPLSQYSTRVKKAVRRFPSRTAGGRGRPATKVFVDVYVSGIKDDATNLRVIERIKQEARDQMIPRAPSSVHPDIEVFSLFHGDESEPHFHNGFAARLPDGYQFHQSREELETFRKDIAEICGHTHVPHGKGRSRMSHAEWRARQRTNKGDESENRRIVRSMTKNVVRGFILSNVESVLESLCVNDLPPDPLNFLRALEGSGIQAVPFQNLVDPDDLGIDLMDFRSIPIRLEETSFPNERFRNAIRTAVRYQVSATKMKHDEYLRISVAVEDALLRSRNLREVRSRLSAFGVDSIYPTKSPARKDIGVRIRGQAEVMLSDLRLSVPAQSMVRVLAQDKRTRDSIQRDLSKKLCLVTTSSDLQALDLVPTRRSGNGAWLLRRDDGSLLSPVWVVPPSHLLRVVADLDCELRRKNPRYTAPDVLPDDASETLLIYDLAAQRAARAFRKDHRPSRG